MFTNSNAFGGNNHRSLKASTGNLKKESKMKRKEEKKTAGGRKGMRARNLEGKERGRNRRANLIKLIKGQTDQKILCSKKIRNEGIVALDGRKKKLGIPAPEI